MGILNEVVTSIPFGVSLLLPLSWGAFCDYWWKIVLLTLGLATFLWAGRRITGCLTKPFSRLVRDALIFGGFSWTGFHFVLEPNYGHKVIGLPCAYAIAHLLMFFIFFFIPQLENIEKIRSKLLSLCKIRITLRSLLNLLKLIPTFIPFIKSFLKPNLTFFVRTNGSMKYTIFFSKTEQVVYYAVLLASVLILLRFKPQGYKPNTQ